MAESKTDEKQKLLTRAVKTVGRLLGPTTPTGRAFGFVEQNVTRVVDRLGQSERYLDFVGKAMSQNFRSRARVGSVQESVLHVLRLPTASEVDALRRDVRTLHDQMEALTTQLEIVLGSVEKNQATSTAKDQEDKQ